MLGAGAAVAGLAVVSVKAASDLGESMNKARIIFGDSSSEVIKFSENTAESMGIAQSAALEAAGGFGAMFDSAGLAEQAAADMSIEMVQLAADMASFNNQDPSEMLERLRGGLAGEAEPLRRFGVFISEARVQTEAYASGIARAGAELTDAQKVQARFNIIMQDTAKQQGDFARTVGTSLPNQIRKLKAELIDLAAKIGKELLPVAVELLEVLLDIIDAAEIIVSPVTKTGQAIEDLGGKFGTMDDHVVKSFQDMFNFNETAAKTEFAARAAGGAIKEIERSVTLADGSVKTFTDVLVQGEDGIFHYSHTIGAASDALKTFGTDIKHAGNQGRIFGKELRESLSQELPAIRGTITSYKETFTLSPTELNKIARSWVEIGRTIRHDLKEILESDLRPEVKRQLAALPPEMRHAFVEGNKQERNQFLQSMKATYDIEDSINRMVGTARRDSPAVGTALIAGVIQGVINGEGRLATVTREAVRNAIKAAEDEAGIGSPSKEMMEVGRDMALGLVEGFIREQEKVAEKWRGMLQNLLNTAKSFRDSIRGGFSSLLGISGAFGTEEAPATPGSIAEFFAGQVQSAQQFAHVLEALRRQGASKRLLSEIAGAGPEGIPFAKALLQGGPQLIRDVSNSLQQIAHVASDVSEQLTKSFFGEKLDAVRDQLSQENNKLQTANELLRRIEAQDRKNITINISGVIGNETAVIQHIRDGLNRLANRNATSGLRS